MNSKDNYELDNSALIKISPPINYPSTAPSFIWNEERFKKNYGITSTPPLLDAPREVFDNNNNEPDMDVQKLPSRKSLSRRSLSINFDANHKKFEIDSASDGKNKNDINPKTKNGRHVRAYSSCNSKNVSINRKHDSIHFFDKSGPTSPNSISILSFRIPSKSQLKIVMSPHKNKESRSIDYISKMTHEWNSIVKSGDSLDKYSIDYEPQRRFFKVSEDEEFLLWGHFSFALLRKESLIDVEFIQYGINYSERFSRVSLKNGRPWLCFSLVFQHRSIDLECKDESQIGPWFMGLQSCVPMNHSTIPFGKLLWKKASLKLAVCSARMRVAFKTLLILLIKESARGRESKIFIDVLYPGKNKMWWQR